MQTAPATAPLAPAAAFSPAPPGRILQWPDPRVTTPCRLVPPEEFGQAQKLAAVLLETLLTSSRPGTGLSANQIGATLRVFVVDTSKVRGLDTALINPQMWPDGLETEGQTESCLSLPTRCLPTVPRWKRVRVRWIEPVTLTGRETIAEGLAARVVQHEMDHLDGRLITHFMSRQQRRQLEREVGR